MDHSINQTPCAVGDEACESAKEIIDSKLLRMPKVVSSGMLEHVHASTGLDHLALHLSWGANASKDGRKTHIKVPYNGVEPLVLYNGEGSTSLDDASLVKFVDASNSNGCNSGSS